MTTQPPEELSHEEFLERYADQLERIHGPCVSGRPALIEWLDERMDSVRRLSIPGQLALDIISNEYLLWQCEALGMDTRP